MLFYKRCQMMLDGLMEDVLYKSGQIKENLEQRSFSGVFPGSGFEFGMQPLATDILV